MKKSLVVCVEKIYVNKNVHTLIYNKENLKIMGVCQSYGTMDFIERTISKAQKEQISRYLFENCIKSEQCFTKRKISGTTMIRNIILAESKIKTVLLVKGISIIGFYQKNGVDFIEGLDKQVKIEVLKQLYMFNHITADTYARIVNKLEI